MNWEAGVRSVHAEAAGLMSLHVIRQIDAAPLLEQALHGDTEAVWLSIALHEALDLINKAAQRKPMLCGCCPRFLRSGNFSVVIAAPERADPTKCITLGICRKCATEPDAIRIKALQAFRKIWPDARPITINTGHKAGQA